MAYAAWRGANGEAVQPDAFKIRTVTTDFQGSLYSKVLSRNGAKDSIEFYQRRDEPAYTVSYNFGREQADSVYMERYLSRKDKYQVFLGGNHPEITIETAVHNGRRLLLLKDSFANALIPFLVNDFETIHVIDLRYYNGALSTYIAENQINEYMVCYNIKNFCEDKNLVKLGR